MPGDYTKVVNKDKDKNIERIRIECGECRHIYTINIDGSETDDPTLNYNGDECEVCHRFICMLCWSTTGRFEGREEYFCRNCA